MRRIDTALILRDTPELAWIGQEAKSELEKIAKLELYSPREMVSQGESSSSIKIVVEGTLHSMLVKGRQESLERIYYENQVFGLDSLFKFNPKNRMVVAERSTLLLTLPLEETHEVLSNCEDTKEVYESLSKQYGAYHFIRNSTFLGELLSPRFLITFVSFFENKHYEDGAPIFRQNDDPDGFYLCNHGVLRVEVSNGEKIVFTTTIKAGDYFGELALTTDSKRSASILSEGTSQCYYLSRTQFDQLVQHEPRLLEGFQLLAKLAYNN